MNKHSEQYLKDREFKPLLVEEEKSSSKLKFSFGEDESAS